MRLALGTLCRDVCKFVRIANWHLSAAVKSTSLSQENSEEINELKLGSLGCGLQELLVVADRHLSAVVEDGGVLGGEMVRV